MGEKLDTGSQFPSIQLHSSDGGSVSLPKDLNGGFGVVVFYRGHW